MVTAGTSKPGGVEKGGINERGSPKGCLTLLCICDSFNCFQKPFPTSSHCFFQHHVWQSLNAFSALSLPGFLMISTAIFAVFHVLSALVHYALGSSRQTVHSVIEFRCQFLTFTYFASIIHKGLCKLSKLLFSLFGSIPALRPVLGLLFRTFLSER